MIPALQEQIEKASHLDPVTRGRAAEALGALGGTEACRVLVGLLEDPDVMVRFKAARELALQGDDRGVPALAWALGRTELCFLALQALTALGSRSALADVRRFFRRWFLHPLERLQAAAALHRMGAAEGTRFLEQKIHSSRPDERGLALELWGRLRMPGCLDLLQGVLSDPNDPHRLDAARGLGHLKDARSLPLLDRLSRQRDDPLLAEEACAAAATIRSQES